ncbi:hypothetical protein WBP07_20125 (plasmid) [Novosphingobium sp. BL-8A]|uniref:hypothetical protein n=1 Tax=Novosphingobium sp. BL-8A TaxID=3127639 RepID=UPI0037583446
MLSITRTEWLPKVKSDLFVFGATTGMPASQIAEMERMARAGQPMSFFGAVSGATDPAFARLLGVTSVPHKPSIQDGVLRATAGAAWPSNTRNLPAEFDAPPPMTRISAPVSNIVYSFGDMAGLVSDQSGQSNLSLWDPAPLFEYWNRPLRDLLNGDPTPFAATAATLNRQLARAGKFGAQMIDREQTGTVAAWTGKDGTVRILAANLEEGLRDDADRSRLVTLRLPAEWRDCRWRPNWSDRAPIDAYPVMDLTLAPQASTLLSCTAVDAKQSRSAVTPSH